MLRLFLWVPLLVRIDTPFGSNRIVKGRFPGSSRCTGLHSYTICMTPPSPPLSFRSFFRFLSVREVLESPFYGYFFYPFWYGVESRLHVCCLISSCGCSATSAPLALACGLAVFLGWRSVLVWFVCSGFLVGIRAPFGRNRRPFW